MSSRAVELKLLHALGVRRSDKNKVLLTLLLVFITGALQCYMSAFPVALFLSNYGSQYLPQVYLVASGVSFACGLSYAFFESRLPFNSLIIKLVCVLSTIITLFALTYIGLGSKWLIVVIIIWTTMAFDLSDFAIWSVINRLYTLQQGKKIFGVISGFQSIGGVLAGLLSPILVIFLDVKYLILFIGILSFFSMFVMIYLLKSQGLVSEENSEDDLVDTSTQSFTMITVIRNPYVLKIFGLISLSIFAMYTIDLFFNGQVEAHYSSEAAVAGFLGTFFGIVYGFNLLLGAFVFKWLLERFGLISSLFILPCAGICITLPLLIMSQVPALIGVVFWIVISLKLADESLRTSLTEIGHLLLLQPFPPKLRSYLQSKNDIIIMPLAMGLVSLCLVILTQSIGGSVLLFTIMCFIFFVLSTLILVTIKPDYVSALTKAIANRYYGHANSQHLSKEDLDFLKNSLVSKYPDEVIFALNSLEKMDKVAFEKALGSALTSSELSVRKYALKKIEQYQLSIYYSEIINIAKNDYNERIRGAALKVASHLNHEKTHELINASFNSDSLNVLCAGIISGLSQCSPDSIKETALKRLQTMLSSYDATIRAAAAYIIGEINQVEANQWLMSLSEDPESIVRSSAYEAILKIKYTVLLPKLIYNLDQLQFSIRNLNELCALKDQCIPIIETNLSSYSEPAQLRCIQLLAYIKEPSARDLLEKLVLNESVSLREAALESLVKLNIESSSDFLEQLHDKIIEEINYLEENRQYLHLTPEMDLTQFLKDVLKRKIERSLHRLFLALSLYYPAAEMLKAKLGLDRTDENEISYAIELVDTALTPAHKKLISPLLSKICFSEINDQANLEAEEFIEVLKRNIQDPNKDRLSVLSCIASSYIIKMASIGKAYPELEELKKHSSILIAETLEWLEKNKEE